MHVVGVAPIETIETDKFINSNGEQFNEQAIVHEKAEKKSPENNRKKEKEIEGEETRPVKGVAVGTEPAGQDRRRCQGYDEIRWGGAAVLGIVNRGYRK